MSDQPLLSVRDLRVGLSDARAQQPLVTGIDLDVNCAEVVGIVGESGSGKSLTIRSCMRLLPRGLAAEGSIAFDGREVMTMRPSDLARFRARDVALIHQDPRSCINPTHTIGQFLVEGVVKTGLMSPDEAFESARQLVRDVGIIDPERRMDQYPFQLSGGLLQRMMIVAALLPNPTLIFADEPTTALDVTVQSDVMAILIEQVEERHASMLIVTHDLDLAAAVSDRMVVMRSGRVVEAGTADAISQSPEEPYTQDLLNSRPSFTGARAAGWEGKNND